MATMASKPSIPPVLVKKVRLTGGASALVPETAYDAELLDGYPFDHLFVLKPEARRSGKLHRTYWKALTEAVNATGIRPNAEKLHDALMWDLGYITVDVGFDGQPRLVRDSIAFDNMPSDAQFKPYFDAAMQRLGEVCGVDPLEFLKENQA
jgi:hypothetical protein